MNKKEHLGGLEGGQKGTLLRVGWGNKKEHLRRGKEGGYLCASQSDLGSVG